MSEMNRRHLLIGAYWFQMYTTFWAVLVLVFYSVENGSDRSMHEYFNDAVDGKEMLATMAKRSAAADRCNTILEQVFSRLPERLQRGRQASTSSTDTRKRHAQSSTRGEVDIGSSGNSRGGARSFSSQFAMPQRSSTMPQHQHSVSGNHKRTSLSNLAYGHSAHSSTDPYRMAQAVYTPTSSNDQMTPRSGASPEIPSSPVSNINFNAAANSTGTEFGINPAVQDLASIMFPSNDPFAYPNQPMTTFESQYGPSVDTVSGTFDLDNDASQPRVGQATFGDFMQSMQSASSTSRPLGPSVPADLMSGDWIRGTATPTSTPASLARNTTQSTSDNMQNTTGLTSDHGINYDSLFSAGDMGLTNMNGPLWFNDSLV